MASLMYNTNIRATDGSIQLGGCPASELAASYGTPLLVLDTDVLDQQIEAFLTIARPFGIEVAYAGKALLLTALARHLSMRGLALDCCSLGEIVTAEAAGYPPELISLHGCAKTTEELQAVVAGRVGRSIVDNFDELVRLAALARSERPVAVVLRVNTGIEAHTHECVRTGGDNTKFGFALSDVDRAIAFIQAEPALRLQGLHAHIGSQIIDADPFVLNLDVLMELYVRAHHGGFLHGHDLILGGGFGVPMHPDEEHERMDIPRLCQALAQRAQQLAEQAGVPVPHLGIEPGRAIIAEAGTSLYRVSAVKQQGKRRFVIVDGGMTDNPRPALYQSYHHPFLASRVSSAAGQLMTVCGRTCENDELVQAELPRDLATGDLLALGVTGAYTYSMASNYNRFSRPAVIFAGQGEHRLVARRETPDELLRYDV